MSAALVLVAVQLSVWLTASAAPLACTTWKVSTAPELTIPAGATVRRYYISADVDKGWSYTPLRKDNCNNSHVFTDQQANATWRKARFTEYTAGFAVRHATF